MNEHCILCGDPSPRALCVPGVHSIASDLRLLESPLQKLACEACGFIFRSGPSPVDFNHASYSLYDHVQGRSIEAARQAIYARWLIEVLAFPDSIFEAGCGNGSLLTALKSLAPSIDLRGVEPAPGAAQAARDAGLDVATAMLEDDVTVKQADVALSINVIEHTDDPQAFLRALAKHGQRIAVCCPDGSHPNTELLFADHRWSFAPVHMKKLFSDAGLDVEGQHVAPSELGSFFLTVGKKARNVALHEEYLAAWARLDDVLLARIRNGPVHCFGAGEAAALLRAYAPRTWQRVTACIVDEVAEPTFGTVPVIHSHDVSRVETLLLGVHPRSQHIVANRFSGVANNIVRWDDVIPS